MAYIADYGTRLRVMGAEHENRREAGLRRALEERVDDLEKQVAALAQAIEAQRAETPKSGSVHESAAPKGCAQCD
jgi:hypothetical protein